MPRYWISFDIGLQGDYAPLYEWLDRHEALECGDSVATLRSGSSREQIGRQLAALLKGQKNARVYIIAMEKGVGRFVLGKRRASPPWKGYAAAESSAGDEA